jgi:HEAT repeat protein
MSAAAEMARGCLKDTEWVVRTYAVSALARMGAPDAHKIAEQMTKDPDPNVRERAQQILKGEK